MNCLNTLSVKFQILYDDVFGCHVGITANGLPLAAGPISKCLIAKVSERLCEVKINYANAPQCPPAKQTLIFTAFAWELLFCPGWRLSGCYALGLLNNFLSLE
jgi:hypothetical protein